ncbi:MAG: fibronectin type III domain-containing protein [Vicinamibacterales bacterium]
MRGRPAQWCAVGLVAVVLVAPACGKKGNPLPPLRPLPGRIADLSVRRLADRVEVQFTVPPLNADGSAPPAVDHVDVYAQRLATGVPKLTLAQLLGQSANLKTRIPVRRPDPSAPEPPANASDPAAPGAAPASRDIRPLAGERALFVERLDAASIVPGTVLYVAAVGVAGQGRGRQGPPSDLLTVTLGPLPPPPDAVVLSHDEKSIKLTWKAGAPQQRFQVYRGVPGADLQAAELLTSTPTAAAEMVVPVGDFGREHCFSIRTLEVTGSVTVEGAPGPAQCITPVDTYPPAAPTGLQAVQEGPSVRLIWNPVEALDLAGYMILRGEGAGENMQPLTRTPQTESTYRDTTVVVGASYTYAVIAVDKAATPNVSQQSNRQTVPVR